MSRSYFVYIVTNQRRTVFYTGITNHLKRRVYEHKNKLVEGFTERYNVTELIYYEIFNNPRDAIEREKQLKDYRREKKLILIQKANPLVEDLYDII